MSDGKEENIVKLIKTLGEIGAYVTAIVAYFLALMGKAPPPYPSSVALLTLLITMIMLWIWRWPKITRQIIKNPQKPKKKNGRKIVVEKDDFLDPFRVHGKHLYQESLFQRRLEVIGLICLSLGSLGLGYFKIPAIQEEITGFHCLTNAKDFRVVIANFSPESHQFENDLANIMVMQAHDRFQICRYYHQAELIDQAQDVGVKNKAKLVISGNNSDGLVNIYLTAIDWEMLNQRHGALPVNKSQEEAAFLAENISAEILYSQGDIAEAQSNLSAALDAAELQDWAMENKPLLADGYFLLGLLFDPDQVPRENANIKEAIKGYSNAIKWYPNLESAYLNRASLYSSLYDQNHDLDDLEKAITDSTFLINNSGGQIVEAYLMRSQLYLDKDMCLESAADLETILKDPTVDENNLLYQYMIYYLGKSYILCKDYKSAEKIYEKMPVLSEDDVDFFVSDLKDMADDVEDPAGKEVIIEVINLIQQLQSPK